ncbi:sulfate permease [Pseudarthrobacter sp. J1738]|uniref:sulfate permease n=1 Tax=Micrococcales TaxID=85006 RepID=UPI003B7CFDE9
MIRLLWAASVQVRYFLRRYMPSNILLDAIRTRRGLKWGMPAMLLAIPYLGVAYLLSTAAQNDGPGWLNLFVFVAIWSALKMLWIGPISLVLLARARAHEYAQHRAIRKAEKTEQDAQETDLILAGGR